ncbi:MAG: mutator mutT protein [Osedax symbiont Rs1]|nr:MAG: mutator mutT protein [Osedax symbiont Rs1]
MQVIQVAAAVIFDKSGKIFLAKRANSAHQGGLWEFAGGKLEADESSEQALKRELLEELGISIIAANPFLSIQYDYPDKSISLAVFTVTDYRGEPWGKEGQETAWCAVKDLHKLAFPAANLQIVEKIQREYLSAD